MAFEPIAVAWPEERILHADARVLVVNKPRGLPVHGGTPDFDDVVTRLARWLRERDESDYLSVHSRLDKEVSGVLVFGRSRSENQSIAREFESHRVLKRYVAVVRDHGLPERFEMRDRLQPSEQGPTRVVREGGVDAVTSGVVMARQNGRALVELRPQTGRRHQLRVQLAQRGAPICGDSLYGGERALRLMLHAVGVESKVLGWHFELPTPEEFKGYGLEYGLGSSERLRRALFDAAWLREPLTRSSDAMRLVNADGDGLPGVAVDRYGDFAVLELFSEEALQRSRELCGLVHELGARGVYSKIRRRGDLRRANVDELAASQAECGENAPEAFLIRECGVPAEVRLGDGWDVGIYLDQRDNRRRVMAAAKNRSVLNLFGYTGTFSVAAALGGANRTVTVDLSGRALERARRNLELAQVPSSGVHEFVRADVIEWFARAKRGNQRFGLIILDPPSFSTTGRGKVFRLADAWDELLQGTLGLLEPKGQMLVISHERGSSQNSLRRRILRAAQRVGHSSPAVRDLNSSVDFPDGLDGPWPSFGLWVALR